LYGAPPAGDRKPTPLVVQGLKPSTNEAKNTPEMIRKEGPFSGWWFQATPLKNDGVRQLG